MGLGCVIPPVALNLFALAGSARVRYEEAVGGHRSVHHHHGHRSGDHGHIPPDPSAAPASSARLPSAQVTRRGGGKMLLNKIWRFPSGNGIQEQRKIGGLDSGDLRSRSLWACPE